MGRFNSGFLLFVGPRTTSCQLLSLPIVGRALVAHRVVGICYRCRLVFLSLPIIGRDTTVGIMCFLGWTILDACVWILCGAKGRENACHAVCLAIPPHVFHSPSFNVRTHPPSSFRTRPEPIHPPIAEPFHNPLTPSSFRTRLEPIHPPIAEPFHNPLTPSNFRTLSEPIHPTLFQRPHPLMSSRTHTHLETPHPPNLSCTVFSICFSTSTMVKMVLL